MDQDVKAVFEAEDRRRTALVGRDLLTLDALFADDLLHIHSSAVVHTKAQLLEYYAEDRRTYTALERGPLAVRIAGDVAVITGRMISHMRVDEKERVLNGMITQVLRREAGTWRFINFQFTLGEG